MKGAGRLREFLSGTNVNKRKILWEKLTAMTSVESPPHTHVLHQDNVTLNECSDLLSGLVVASKRAARQANGVWNSTLSVRRERSWYIYTTV